MMCSKWLFTLVLILFGWHCHAQLINAQFIAPDTVCVNQTFTVANTSTGTSNSYYWSTCSSAVASAPTIVSLGNPNSVLNVPVYMTINEDNGTYYAFVTNNATSSGVLSRLSFGASLANTPTGFNLGNLGGQMPAFCEDLFIRKEGTIWYGIAVGGNPTGSITKINFGTTLNNNSPTAVNVAVANLNYPDTIEVFEVSGTTYAFVCNRLGNDITLLNFGTSLNNTPTSVSLGGFSLLSSPSQMCLTNSNGNWHLFVTNDGNSTITRLDFGSNLLSIPTASNLGNPSSMLSNPRGIALDPNCDGVTGLLGNMGSTIRTISIPGSATGAISMGNLSGLTGISFPQTLYRARINDNSSYFVVNATNNTISRIDYNICNSIPSSTLFTPPPMTFTAAGAYTINLACNMADYNQARYCKRVVAVNPPTVNITAPSTVCAGGSVTISVNTTAGATYAWSGPNSFSSISPSFVISNASALQSGIYSVTVSLQSCGQASSHTLSVTNVISLTTTSAAVCPSAVATVTASGAQSYTWFPNGVNSPILSMPLLNPGIYTVSGSDANGCKSTVTTQLIWLPTPTISFATFSITCGSLGSATAIASGTGAFSYSWMPTAQTGSVVNNLFPGTYTLTIFNSATGCTHTASTVFLPLVPLTGTVTATSMLLCNTSSTGTAAISLSGGSGQQTYNWTSAVNSQTTALATGLAAGITTVTVTDALTFCQVTHTFLITQPPALTLNLSASSPTACVGNTVNLTALINGGTSPYSYTWVPGPTNTNALITESTAGTFSYNLFAKDANACLISNYIQIQFIARPILSLPSITVCSLQTSLLNASGASTYTWNTGSNQNPISISVSNTTIFSVVGTSLGCTSNASTMVYVNANPTVQITSNSPICENDTLQISASGQGVINWSGPQNFSASLNSFTFINATANLSGIYSLTITAPNSCTSSLSQSITVHAKPVVSAVGSTVCVGSNLTLSSNFLPNAAYQWFGPSYTSNQQNNSVPNANLNHIGTYTLTIVNAAGCSNTATTTCSVVVSTGASIVAPSAACAGTAIQLQALGQGTASWIGPANYYTLSPTPILYNSNITNSGIYTLTLLYGPCTSTAVTSITILPIPIISVSSPTPFCENSIATFSVNGGTTYTWSGPSLNQATMLGTISFPVSANSAGIYSVTGENQFSCKSTNTLQVLVLPAPIISVSNQTTCIGGNFNYTITGAQTYTWTGPSNFTTTGAAIHMTNCNDSNEGQYVVIATGTNNCKNSASLTLNVFTVSPAQVSIQGKNTICRNDYTQLIIKGANTYKWYGPNGFTSVNDTVTIFGFGQIVSGIYTVECKDALFCNSTKTLQLSLMENPKLQFENINNATCVPFCNRFRFTISPEPATTKLIQVFDQLNKVVDITQNYCFEKPGQYFFHSFYRDTNNCLATASLIVTAHERILADFIYTPEKAIAGNDVINFYNSSIGNNQSQWSWIFGTSDTSYYQGQNQHYSFQQSGNYPIVLIVSNKWQCQDTVIKVISVGSEYSFYIPNCFSPNGDGINDDFGAKAFGIIDFHITIFNRWGALIFESSELDRRWDGTFKNTLCPPDVYTYRIATKDFAGNRKEYAGHVSILK